LYITQVNLGVKEVNEQYIKLAVFYRLVYKQDGKFPQRALRKMILYTIHWTLN